MFSYCTSLTEAPELPATELTEECYSSMFYDCTSLKKAPYLPATTLVESCYNSMFWGCSVLDKVEVNFVEWKFYSSTYRWLYETSTTGTFICPTDMDVSQRDVSHIPQMWTVEYK